MKKIQLKDGIDLYLNRDGKFKTYMASVIFYRPLTREGASYGSLLTGMLKMGNRLCRTNRELNIELDKLYGAWIGCSSGKRGEEQNIRVAAETVCDEFLPTPVFDRVLELLFATAFGGGVDGKFDPDKVNQEKINLIDRIRNQINDKRYYASMRLDEIMFEGEGCGVNSLGYEEDVEKITPESLYDYYREVINTSGISIIFTGNFDEAAAEKAARRAVEPLSAREAAHTLAKIKSEVGEVKRVTDHMDVTQGKLAIGMRTGIAPTDDMAWAQRVFSVIYGGGPSSKLFNNVRERLSLCYYASSWPNDLLGVLNISSGIEFQNFDAAYNEIMAQLQAMRDGDFTDEDIDVAKKEICNGYRSRLDSVEAMEGFHTGQILLGRDMTVQQAIEKIENVTRAEIIDAANRVKLDTVYFLAGKEEA